MPKIFGFQKLLGEFPPPLLIVPVLSQFSTQFLKITKKIFSVFQNPGGKNPPTPLSVVPTPS
jgi:hypothetical protein